MIFLDFPVLFGAITCTGKAWEKQKKGTTTCNKTEQTEHAVVAEAVHNTGERCTIFFGATDHASLRMDPTPWSATLSLRQSTTAQDTKTGVPPVTPLCTPLWATSPGPGGWLSAALDDPCATQRLGAEVSRAAADAATGARGVCTGATRAANCPCRRAPT